MTPFAQAFNNKARKLEGQSFTRGAQVCGDGIVYLGHYGAYRAPDDLTIEQADAWGKEEDQRELARIKA